METSTNSSSGQQLNSRTLDGHNMEQETRNGNTGPSIQNLSGGGSSGYNSQDFVDVFSYDELYAVMDSSNREEAATESGDSVNFQFQNSGLTPISSFDVRQLQVFAANSDDQSASAAGDGELPTSGYISNGRFLRLISSHGDGGSNGTTAASLSKESASSVITNGDTFPPRENLSASFSGGNGCSGRGSNGSTPTPASNHENSQSEVYASPASRLRVAQVKVRKPRGRKPKHVKEAEAAAAAAASAASPGNNVERKVSSPTMNASFAPLRANLREVVEGCEEESNVNSGMQLRRRESQLQQQLEGNASVSQPPCPTYTSSNFSMPQPPLNKFSPQQRSSEVQGPPGKMSLEQLAYQDRRVILMARMPNIRPDNITSNEQSPPHFVNQRYHLRSSQRSRAQSPPRRLVNVNPTPRPWNAKATVNSGGRVDQLLPSRIAAPLTESIVKPKIIQENPSMYNLLTRPAPLRPSASGFDNRKVTQERWMQCPYPSIHPQENDSCSENRVNSRNGARDNTHPHSNVDPGLGGSTSMSTVISDPSSISNHHRQQHRPILRAHDNPQQSPSVTSRVILGNNGGRVNIRREGASIGTFSPCYPQNPKLRSHNGSTSFTMPSANRGGSSNAGNGCLHSRKYQDLQVRLERMAQSNNELRFRADNLIRVNKQLMTRLRHAYEECEAWKSYAQQSAQFYGDSNCGVGGGAFENAPMLGSLYSPFMDDNFMMRGQPPHRPWGVGEMSGGSNVNSHVGSWDGIRDSDVPASWHLHRNNQSVGDDYNRRDDRPLFDNDDASTSVRAGSSLAGGSLKRLREAALQGLSRKKVCSADASPECESVAEARGDTSDTTTPLLGGGRSVARPAQDKEPSASVQRERSSCVGNNQREHEAAHEVDMRYLNMEGDEDENTGENDGSDVGRNDAPVVVAEDGENSTSALFPSPCCVGSRAGTASTSIFSSSHLNGFATTFGNLFRTNNDISTSETNVNTEEVGGNPVNGSTTQESGQALSQLYLFP